MSALSVAALVLAVIALAVATFAVLDLRRTRRRYVVLWGEGEERQGDVAAVLARQDAAMAAATDEVARARARLETVRTEAGAALRNVAVVRYDAFGDMAGRLSFSVALLDDGSNGLVLSSIHARSESRTYAKAIRGGSSEEELTPEEKQAVASAIAGREIS